MVKTGPEESVPHFVSFDVMIPIYEILGVNESYLILFLRQNYGLPRIFTSWNKCFGLTLCVCFGNLILLE